MIRTLLESGDCDNLLVDTSSKTGGFMATGALLEYYHSISILDILNAPDVVPRQRSGLSHSSEGKRGWPKRCSPLTLHVPGNDVGPYLAR
jgi:hypothetical protein